MYLASTTAWLEEVGSLAKYQTALSERFTALLGPVTGQEDPRTLVTLTWELSLDRLMAQGLPQAREVMRLIGCFASAAIPVSVLVPNRTGKPTHRVRLKVISALTARVQRGIRIREQAWRRTVAALCDLGLLDLS
jgi:hypothetical protein